MPRSARIIIPGFPHHVTQRGNKKQSVFFSDQDRLAYLDDLGFYARRHEVDILSYCLMTNHVHLLLVPEAENCLHLMLKAIHTRHAMRINKQFEWTGHLWQNRYYSAVVDESALVKVARYIEINPVRAKMVEQASDHYWCSASAHCGLRKDALLNLHSKWHKELAAIADWRAWLNFGDSAPDLTNIRTSTNQNRAFGTSSFISALEASLGRCLQTRPRGRPKKGERPLIFPR